MKLCFSLALVLAACTGPMGAPQSPYAAPGGGDGGSVDAPGPGADAGVDGPTPPAITVLRGVDRAGAFSASEAMTLDVNDGVRWTGVYIGGACSAGSGWTKSVVTMLATQRNWLFMPIWVGQQSPSICGASTLTAAQGTTDGNATVAEMATFGWQPGGMIPVVLDLEAGSYTYSPSGALAYAKAWRDAVRAGGYLAYIYSNPTAINAAFDAGVVFDGAWPASWFYTGFHDSKPEDLTQLGTRYTNKNRAWQYAGGFAVPGAGTVDGDCSDLLLAPAPGGTNL